MLAVRGQLSRARLVRGFLLLNTVFSSNASRGSAHPNACAARTVYRARPAVRSTKEGWPSCQGPALSHNLTATENKPDVTA